MAVPLQAGGSLNSRMQGYSASIGASSVQCSKSFPDYGQQQQQQQCNTTGAQLIDILLL